MERGLRPKNNREPRLGYVIPWKTKKKKKTLPVVNENIQGEISGMFNEQKAAAAPVFEIGIKIIQTFNGTRPVVVGKGK